MPWAKGQSGNPGGLPKDYGEIAKLARKSCPEIVKRLTQIALKSKSELAAIRASEVLLERGLGKAIQPVDTGVSLADLLTQAERSVVETALAIVARDAGETGERAETQH